MATKSFVCSVLYVQPITKLSDRDNEKGHKFRLIVASDVKRTYGDFTVTEKLHTQIKLAEKPDVKVGDRILVEGNLTVGDDGERYLSGATIEILPAKK